MASNPPSSPSSSPRLPSPPPMAEDQTGSQSPSLASSELKLGPLAAPDADIAASRRIRPGTKAADMAEGPPLVDFTEIESAFQLTEHLKALHFAHTHPTHLPAVTVPLTPSVALLLANPPPSTDRVLWLYELCRFLVQKVNLVVISLFADQPPCSAATCPEMRASEWQYLCAVHDPPKACCAIDYCCHTLDWAANVLTNPKHFPSRLALGVESAAPQHQVRQLTNIFRRVYRIFAHAWFSHRDMFWRVEGKTGLYVFFKTVCDVYNLLPDDGYTIPPEAENREQDTEADDARAQAVNSAPDRSATVIPPNTQAPPSILKRPPPPDVPDSTSIDRNTHQPPPHPTPINTVIASGATARRHRQTPSTGVSPVDTVLEENEDDESQIGDKDGASANHLNTEADLATSQPRTQRNPLPFSSSSTHEDTPQAASASNGTYSSTDEPLTPETPAATHTPISQTPSDESPTVHVTEIAEDLEADDLDTQGTHDNGTTKSLVVTEPGESSLADDGRKSAIKREEGATSPDRFEILDTDNDATATAGN